MLYRQWPSCDDNTVFRMAVLSLVLLLVSCDVTAATVKQPHQTQTHIAVAPAVVDFCSGAQQFDDVDTGPHRLLVHQPW